MAIEVSAIEVLALKKLTLICHALGQTLSGSAGKEQRALTSVLNDVVLRADVDNSAARPQQGGGE